MTPILYVKRGCPWCDEASEYLKRGKIAHETVMVSGDPAAMDEMRRISGQTKAPVLDCDGEILADFGVDELVPFLTRVGLG